MGSVINIKPNVNSNNGIATQPSVARNDDFFVIPRRESSEERVERREQFFKKS